jgi:hypothetical protein
VSVIGQPDERALTLKALGRALPFVRHELGSRVRLRRIPELHLREDDSAQRGTRVLRLLAELETGGAPDEPAPAESLPTPVPRIPAVPPAESRRSRTGRRSAGDRDRPRKRR